MNQALIETVQELAESGPDAVRGAAAALLTSLEPDASPRYSTVFLLHGPEDAEPASRLADLLERRGLRTDRPGDRNWQDEHCARRMMGAFVVVLAGPTPLDKEVLPDALSFCRDAVVVLLPGEPRPVSPVDGYDVIDLPSLEGGAFERLVDRLHGDGVVEPVERSASKQVIVLDEPVEMALRVNSPRLTQRARDYREPITDETFLWVPGGRFEMGGKAYPDEQPIHWVRVSPYWLARTPVTNRQYALFLEANPESEEPSFWRDRRFSDPSQPVVGVSWHDAVAYCAWLTETSDDGRIFQLPSEAQWEFAARGEEGREYPWGDERPDESRACFGLDREKGKPAAAGSYLGGAGPFEHLDLAGTVLEWCVDLWEPDYQRWTKNEPLDPVGEADDSIRPLRGGCWLFSARDLRSACRYRFRFGLRNVYVGFRVLCAPASE